MDKALQIFDFESRQVRIVLINGEPEFVAKDVVEGVGAIWNGEPAVAHVPSEWKGVRSVMTPGGMQQMTTLKEQGVYFYLARSDKPAALPFQKKIAGEIMPSIRKTGSYSIRKEAPDALAIKKARADAMLNNSRANLARTLEGILERHRDRLSDVSIEAYMGEVLYMTTGIRAIAPRIRKSYRTSELAAEWGVSPQRIGLTATKYNLRTEEYGLEFLDTAPGGKQIPNWRYWEEGREAVRMRLIEDGYLSGDVIMLDAKGATD